MTIEKRNSHQEELADEAELLNGIHYTGNKGPCFGARHSIIILLSMGYSILYATKSVFSILIVAMTSSNISSNADIPTYDWDNKGVILSSFIWLGIPIQLLAGYLGKQYGHKWLVLGAVLVNAVFFMLIPPFAKLMGSAGVIICRIIEGGAFGIIYPVSVGVHGIWTPAEERSKLGVITVVIMYCGSMLSSIGAGQLVVSSWGYPWCCYILGIVSLLWCFPWYFLAHQSPSTHPRITPEERKYIETSLHIKDTRKIPTPWLKLLTSIHFWAPVVAAVGSNWSDAMLSSTNIIYVTNVWKIDVAQSSIVLTLTPLLGLAVGVLLAPLSDFLIGRKILRVVNARRLFHTFGQVGSSVCVLWMGWIPPNSMVWVILNLCILNICSLASSVGGSGLNILDIAPAFAGIIGGFASTFSQCFALFAPMTIDWIITDESDQAQWRIIFFITAGIVVGTTIFFDIFATDKRKWDNDNEDEENNK